MIILGITGTLGAGKGTVVEYLIKKKRFNHYSVSGFLREELVKKHLVVDRPNLRIIGNQIRKKSGPDHIVKLLYHKAKKEKANAIIESVRNPKEAEFIKSRGGYLFAVIANQKKRYQRIKLRAGEKDKITFTVFKQQEQKELKSKDPSGQNLEKCILMSDWKFVNNGTRKELYEKVEKAFKEISQK